jgi:nicotinamidase-related amidase
MPYQCDVIDPAKRVMIVVDMQNDFVAEGAKLQSAQATAMVPRLANTLKVCREKGIRLVYTAHVHRCDGSDMGLFDDLYPQFRIEVRWSMELRARRSIRSYAS